MNVTIENDFVGSLPADPIRQNYLRQVRGACYSFVEPSRAGKPRLLAYAADLAESLGFSVDDCQSDKFVDVFAGNSLLEGMKPFAMCYGGHQFGNWAGQLGDGRAITLGELIDTHGTRQALQLKGAGKTPYSRSADGLAVLRSSLREYVCSEAMHYLGIPTTRALSLVATGDAVIRDMLYDGHPAPEPGAIVCRVAPSFVRFGNFEICAAQRDVEMLKQLADYTISSEFPNLKRLEEPEKYIAWFEDVVDRTIDMIVHWMRVGFVHGVMNTDNMSILGITIDYGPYGWLENYDPDWTPNTTDAATRRYRYGQQPWVAQWNLLQLANSIVPLIGETTPLENALNRFPSLYQERWEQTIRNKLGLLDVGSKESPLVNELETVLMLTETDMTLFFRELANLDITATIASEDPLYAMESVYYAPSSISAKQREQINLWLRNYATLVKHQNQSQEERIAVMNATNPLYVPRNYLAQLAIDEVEKGNDEYLDEWMSVLKKPYTEQLGKDEFAGKRPEWARTRVGCSMLSCSS
ncbi:MAG: YdiU family protein [Gammaproteobacteria bacterium]|nr:YdiU family protein [Gammaproteobacteria bacterium]